MAGFYLMSGAMKRGDTRVLSRRLLRGLEDPGGRAMSFLGLEEKTFLVFGVANKRSVAWAVGRSLEEEGARVVYSVRSEERRKSLEALLGDRPVHVCDVEEEGAVDRLAAEVAAAGDGPAARDRPLDRLRQLLGGAEAVPCDQARRTSSRRPRSRPSRWSRSPAPSRRTWRRDASVVTIGISSLLVTPDNYGYMGPIKAALESSRPLPRQILQRRRRRSASTWSGRGR